MDDRALYLEALTLLMSEQVLTDETGIFGVELKQFLVPLGHHQGPTEESRFFYLYSKTLIKTFELQNFLSILAIFPLFILLT